MKESRSLNSVKNSFSGIASSLSLSVIQFIKRTVFIAFLGNTFLSINGLFGDVLNMLSLADLGLGVAMAYSYYKPIAENDFQHIAALNRLYKRIYNCIAAAITVIGIALIPALPYIINLPENVEHLTLYYLLSLAGLVVTYLFVYKGTLIVAFQKKYIVTNCRIVFNIINLLLQILVICIFKSYVLTLVVHLVISFLNNLVISMIADKRYPYLRDKSARISREEGKNIFKNVKAMFIYKASSVLINSTDNVIISKLVGTLFVGLYSNYLMIINTISTMVSLIFASFTAGVGNVIAVEGHEKQHSMFRKLQIFSFWFGCVLTSSIYVVINDFILAWIGEEYLLDTKTVIAIMLNFFLLCVLQPIWTYREAAGLYQKTKYVMLITAALNIVLSIVMGIHMGLAGILFASAISKLLTYVWYEPILLFKIHFHQKPTGFFLPLILSVAATVGLVVLESLVSGLITTSMPFLTFFLRGLVSFGIANAIYFLVFFRNKDFQEAVGMVLRIFQRKKTKKA